MGGIDIPRVRRKWIKNLKDDVKFPNAFCFFFILILLAGCAFTPQEAVITTNVAVNESNIGNNMTVALIISDERPGKLAGNRGAGMGVGAEITLADVKTPVTTEVEKGLKGHGFRPSKGDADTPRRMKVEIRVVELKFSTGFFTGGYFPRAAIKAIATNNKERMEKFYRAEKEERSVFVHTEEANNKLLSEVLSETLSQLVNDRELMKFLAK